jgi:hypothetical protein
MAQDHPTRRDMLKEYVTPAIFTLAAVPAFASSGSGQDNYKGNHRGKGKGKGKGKNT